MAVDMDLKNVSKSTEIGLFHKHRVQKLKKT